MTLALYMGGYSTHRNRFPALVQRISTFEACEKECKDVIHKWKVVIDKWQMKAARTSICYPDSLSIKMLT